MSRCSAAPVAYARAVPDHRRDAELARRLADEAGRLLLDVREQGLSGRELAAAGDARAHEHLLGRLREERPDDAVLSEEGGTTRPGSPPTGSGSSTRWTAPASTARPAAPTGPCTSRCGRRGELTAGAVALPGARRHLRHRRPGPRVRRAARAVRHRGQPHPAAGLRRRASPSALGAELVPMGSAGVQGRGRARGEVDAYVHAGGQYEWDSAAPVAVARAAGLRRQPGGRLAAALQPSPTRRLPDLLVCRPELADGARCVARACRRRTVPRGCD